MSLDLLLFAMSLVQRPLLAHMPGTGAGQVQSGRCRFEVDILPSGPGTAWFSGVSAQAGFKSLSKIK